MDKNDLAALLVDAPAEEVDRIHRLLHEWSVGPEESFPAQLALLTKAQWRVAATLPRVMKDSRKLIELHLAEYRRQTQSLVSDFATVIDKKHDDLKSIISQHAETVKRDTSLASGRLAEVNEVAKSIQKNLEMSAIEWNRAQESLAQERQMFEKTCQQLNDAVNLRGVHWYIIGSLAACGISLLIGHYVWRH